MAQDPPMNHSLNITECKIWEIVMSFKVGNKTHTHIHTQNPTNAWICGHTKVK